MTPVRKRAVKEAPQIGRGGAVVPLRTSSISTLAAHGFLSPEQLSAAWQFQSLWERYEAVAKPQAHFERVDYSRRMDGYQHSHADVRKELGKLRNLVGSYGFQLLKRVCGDGYHIRDLYRSRRERDMHTDLLRILLDQIAAQEG